MASTLWVTISWMRLFTVNGKKKMKVIPQMQILLVTKQVNLFLKNLRDFQGGWQLFEDSQIYHEQLEIACNDAAAAPPNFQPPRQFTSKSVRIFSKAHHQNPISTQRTQNSEITRRQGREVYPEQASPKGERVEGSPFRPTTIDRKFTVNSIVSCE